MTTVFVTPKPSSDAQSVHLHLHLETTLEITAEEARRRVNRQVVMELGTGLAAQPPDLGIAEQTIVWRVPITLSLPELGDLGQVGVIEVDSRSGEILSTDEVLERITQHARRLFAGATLQAK